MRLAVECVVQMCSAEEVKAIDSIIDVGPRVAGHMNRSAVLSKTIICL